MKTRYITRIVLHCTATREGQPVSIADIDRWHKAKGWSGIGYNYLVDLHGDVKLGRPEIMVPAHVFGWNADSLGHVYAGGLDSQGTPKDTRTEAQKAGQRRIIEDCIKHYPSIVDICGHRDLSPDVDGDGVIEPFEWMKACPSFSVEEQLKAWGLGKFWNPESRKRP